MATSSGLSLKPRLVLFEDEKLFREALVSNLRELGLIVRPCSTSQKAHQLVRGNGFDGAVFDICEDGEPVGLKLCEEFVNRHPGSPLFAITGYAKFGYGEKVEELGGQVFVKPARLPVIAPIIRDQVLSHWTVEAVVEYETDTGFTVSFEDPALGFVMLDMTRSGARPSGIARGAHLMLRRHIRHGEEIAYSVLPRAKEAPSRGGRDDSEPPLHGALLPPHPSDFDDEQEFGAYESQLKEFFNE